MILNEKTFQKYMVKIKKLTQRCLFCCPGLRAGGYCMCLFLLILECWFGQNICVCSSRWSWPFDMEHPRWKECFLGPPTDMLYTVQYPDVFGVRRCKEGVKPDFPLPDWEATVGKAGMVWEKPWPRSGRFPRRDGILNCAHPSGLKQQICVAPATLRTGKKHRKWQMETKRSKNKTSYNIMGAAGKTGRENLMVLLLFAFALRLW